MANNQISISYLNNQNRKDAVKRLEELQEKQKNMDCTYEEVIIDGKKSIVERFHPKPKK